MPPALEVAAASGLTLAALTGAAAHAALNAGSQLCGPVLVAPPGPDQITLTFDDGPNPSATPHLLEVLARHKVHATFFLIGRYVQREPALAREIAAAGHIIGNHTMTHPWLPLQPASRIREELFACNRILEDTLGAPITLFRPPFGARRPAVLRIARDLGLTTVLWNVIVSDWKPLRPQVLLSRLELGITRNRDKRHGTNIVLHDGGQHEPEAPRLPTVQAVDLLLSRLSPRSTFVTPPEWHSASSHIRVAQ